MEYASNNNGERQARMDAEVILSNLPWQKAYDFLERLYSHLAQDAGHWEGNDFEITTPKSQAQAYIANELQRMLLEEGLAFEFRDGSVYRRGRKHTVDQATRAQVVLGDERLSSSRKHYEKALQFFRNPTKPDFENCVKEAVCAVEAAGKALFPAANASTLGDLAKWFATSRDAKIPKALIQTITGIYAYRSGGDGVGHGGAQGGTATREVAEYVLSVCASQVIFLVDTAKEIDEVPF